MCVCVSYELQVMFVACVGGAWLGACPRFRGAVLCMCVCCLLRGLRGAWS